MPQKMSRKPAKRRGILCVPQVFKLSFIFSVLVSINFSKNFSFVRLSSYIFQLKVYIGDALTMSFKLSRTGSESLTDLISLHLHGNVAV